MSVQGIIESSLREYGLLEGAVWGSKVGSRREADAVIALTRAIGETHKRWRWAPLAAAVLYMLIFCLGLGLAYTHRADVRVVLAIGSALLFTATVGLRALWREVILGEILGVLLPRLPPEEAIRVAYETYRYARKQSGAPASQKVTE